MITEIEINQVYSSLIIARNGYREAGEEAITLKTALDIVRAEKILAGTITGKNAEEREASARAQLAEMYDQLERAEHAERYAKCVLDCANIEIDRVKLLVLLLKEIIPDE